MPSQALLTLFYIGLLYVTSTHGSISNPDVAAVKEQAKPTVEKLETAETLYCLEKFGSSNGLITDNTKEEEAGSKTWSSDRKHCSAAERAEMETEQQRRPSLNTITKPHTKRTRILYEITETEEKRAKIEEDENECITVVNLDRLFKSLFYRPEALRMTEGLQELVIRLVAYQLLENPNFIDIFIDMCKELEDHIGSPIFWKVLIVFADRLDVEIDTDYFEDDQEKTLYLNKKNGIGQEKSLSEYLWTEDLNKRVAKCAGAKSVVILCNLSTIERDVARNEIHALKWLLDSAGIVYLSVTQKETSVDGMKYLRHLLGMLIKEDNGRELMLVSLVFHFKWRSYKMVLDILNDYYLDLLHLEIHVQEHKKEIVINDEVLEDILETCSELEHLVLSGVCYSFNTIKRALDALPGITNLTCTPFFQDEGPDADQNTDLNKEADREDTMDLVFSSLTTLKITKAYKYTSKTIKKLVKAFPNVTHLEIIPKTLTSSLVQSISSFQHLQSLVINRFILDSSIALQLVEHLPFLKHLSISAISLSGEDGQAFSKFHNIETLVLRGAYSSDFLLGLLNPPLVGSLRKLSIGQCVKTSTKYTYSTSLNVIDRARAVFSNIIQIQ
ncbi:hypothetical protein NECID01_0217 [Nematocida sp. AWRm77]|nr:hypothetical protein NECID01_0217 [Nematocida sp. AWRm77]